MKKFTLLPVALLSVCSLFAQTDVLDELLDEQKPKREYIAYTFKTTRVISAHSIETVKKYALDFRISHRFGDMAASNNDHVHSMFGFDQAADILFAFEYGATDDLTIGIGRAKGAGPLRELWNGNIKYRVLKQTKDFKIPVTITLFANASISSMKNSNNPASLNYFPKNSYNGFADRMSYTMQALVACKATKWLSLQLSPTFVWRNRVPHNDKNGMFFLGFSGRAKFTQRAGFIFEYFLPIIKPGVGGREYFPMVRGLKNAPYYPAVNLGFEFETGGHVFHINLTNTRGMLEQDFLPYNNANWLQGAFRLGFTISRTFQLNERGAKYWKKGSVEDSKSTK
ncbi:MAG: hypothetical protein KIS94_01865 [Chitinophagales bacterium]|nr:hypothetical protein [Chitinophagales bacterium]